MSEYIIFWGIVTLALFFWANLVLMSIFKWMDNLLDEIRHMNYNKAITKEDE